MNAKYFFLLVIFLCTASVASAAEFKVNQPDYHYSVRVSNQWVDAFDPTDRDPSSDIDLAFAANEMITISFSQPDEFSGTIHDYVNDLIIYYRKDGALCKSPVPLEKMQLGSETSLTPLELEVQYPKLGLTLYQTFVLIPTHRGHAALTFATYSTGEERAIALKGLRQALRSYQP